MTHSAPNPQAQTSPTIQEHNLDETQAVSSPETIGENNTENESPKRDIDLCLIKQKIAEDIAHKIAQEYSENLSGEELEKFFSEKNDHDDFENLREFLRNNKYHELISPKNCFQKWKHHFKWWEDFKTIVPTALLLSLSAGLFGIYSNHEANLREQNTSKILNDQRIVEGYMSHIKEIKLSKDYIQEKEGIQKEEENVFMQEKEDLQEQEENIFIQNLTLVTLRELSEGTDRKARIVLFLYRSGISINNKNDSCNSSDLEEDFYSYKCEFYKTANLKFVEFKGLVLKNINLAKADLRGATFPNTNLEQAKFSYADFSCDMIKQPGPFSWFPLSEDEIEILKCADLSEANLTRADLSEADLTRAKLERADLTGADLTGADLIGADLIGAKLARADLTGADLQEAHLECSSYNNRRSNTSKTNAPKDQCADLTRANLSKAQLSKANFTKAKLNGADLTGAILIGANLQQTTLHEACDHLDNKNPEVKSNKCFKRVPAKLIKANLRNADLTGVDLKNADLTDAKLINSKLTGADLTGADLTGADLTGADLTGADLTGADLTGADLTGADLTGADLTGAKLINANLKRYHLIKNIEEKISKDLSDSPQSPLRFKEEILAKIQHDVALSKRWEEFQEKIKESTISDNPLEGRKMAVEKFKEDLQKYRGITNLTNTKLIGTDLTEVKYDQTMEVNGAKFINNPGISEELESFLIEKGARKGYI
ncbi:MAG: pentapeptide repeat-containing protein [Roseofilum sp. SBFL]|uniref:pentapeptide repeat-containing protein n=1 Tax=unclassified Roseofilum TaxID=2620099 RepID=UPI001B1BB972|nr:MULTISPECIES: pentapeptide repeat-containing protein [unclassified Roseofilum]MBP0036308.1 pentapeptide repeat-containing protein [Roseofilum sp. SID1]MBP0044889.1 pentapeptide repeat-containing protein [Roseofilum sp. SBFL]